jgi:hypothetical protein
LIFKTARIRAGLVCFPSCVVRNSQKSYQIGL